MLALMLDSWYKGMQILAKFIGKQNAIHLIQKYDDLVLILQLMLAYQQLNNTAPAADKLEINIDQDGDDSGDDIFAPVQAPLAIRASVIVAAVKDELELFRQHKVTQGQPNCALKWWKKFESKFRVVRFLARNYLAIPGSKSKLSGFLALQYF